MGYSPWGCKESDTTARLSPFLPRPEPLLTVGAHSSAPSVPRRAPVVPARRCHRVLLSLPPT